MKKIISILIALFVSITVMSQDVIIGTQTWMGENLNIGTMIPLNKLSTNNGTIEKYCPGNIEINCSKYGSFYAWDEMMNYVSTEGTQGICPEGYHVPSWADWQVLINYVKNEGVETLKPNDNVDISSAAGINLRSVNGWNKSGDYPGRDFYGFMGLPSGYIYCGASYANGGTCGYFWSSTKPTAYPYYFSLNCCIPAAGTKPAMTYKDGTYRSYMPVRCVKN